MSETNGLVARGQLARLSRGKRVLHPPPPLACAVGQTWLARNTESGRWPPRLVVLSCDPERVKGQIPGTNKTRTYTMRRWLQLYAKDGG